MTAIAGASRAVNFGVIGCGAIGPQHMESIQELPAARLVAVADIDAGRASAAAEKFGAARHYSDPISLLDDPEIEAVVLALPAGFRADLSVEALRRGKHVMLEKPPARDVAELDAMASAAASSGKSPLVACASARYMLVPHSAIVRDYIASGALGDIRSIHFRNLVPPGPPPASPPPSWRVSHQINGGGILVNWSSYEIDYVFGMTSWTLRPRHVLACWWQIPSLFQQYVAPGSDADEHFAAMITCDPGVTVYLERGERVASSAQEGWQITGTRGSMSLSLFPEDHKRVTARDFARGGEEIVLFEGAETVRDSRIGIIDDFAKAILSGRQPQTNLARARIIQQIIDAIYLSGNENRPVEIL